MAGCRPKRGHRVDHHHGERLGRATLHAHRHARGFGGRHRRLEPGRGDVRQRLLRGVPRGTMVTLSATPASGAVFTGWTGACSGQALTCSVAMGSDLSVTAAFKTLVRDGAHPQRRHQRPGQCPEHRRPRHVPGRLLGSLCAREGRHADRDTGERPDVRSLVGRLQRLVADLYGNDERQQVGHGAVQMMTRRSQGRR